MGWVPRGFFQGWGLPSRTPVSLEMVSSNSPRRQTAPALLIVPLGVFLHAVFLQSALESRETATRLLMSVSRWHSIVERFGGRMLTGPDGRQLADVSLFNYLAFVAVVTVVSLLAGGFWIGRRSGNGFGWAVARWGGRGWRWWLLPGLWQLLMLSAVAIGFDSLVAFLLASVPLWETMLLAGWLSSFLALSQTRQPPDAPDGTRSTWALRVVLLAAAAWAVMFTWFNWDLYHNLQVPHGDSAMYEEHLWNTWHGKGFRSFLDDGRLFLGEHPQVIHLLLSPLYWLWSSHLLLELCESVALAAGAIPVFRMARRHSGSDRAAVALAAAYLLAFPLQFLDVAIDLKTFRPISFGVPLLLAAIDQLELRRWRTGVVLLLLTLAAKEDYALVIAPLGLWYAMTSGGEPADQRRRTRRWGVGITLGAVLYVMLVVAVIIPLFRGDNPHYARYFGELGDTPGKIVRTAITSPGLVLGKLISLRSASYALALLVPIGLLPLASPRRLAVCLPAFAVLCLLEMGEAVVPFHHFHAPLLPILFWAAAASLDFPARPANRAVSASHLAWTAALVSGLFFTIGPLGLASWDPGSSFHWKKLRVPDRRAELFPQAFAVVPPAARVFSTDHIHPRFTHHARSYDFSGFARKSDEELADPVPGVDYYIVIDCWHRFSNQTLGHVREPSDLAKLGDNAKSWSVEKLVRDDDGTVYFVVFRRSAENPRIEN